MPEDRALYEGMFLLSQQAASDLNAAVAQMREILNRAQADVVGLYKWDERKLAYPIAGQRRGVFLLAMFRADGAKIAGIERDCNLSDDIVRCLLLRTDHLGDIEVEGFRKDVEASLDPKLRGSEVVAAAPDAKPKPKPVVDDAAADDDADTVSTDEADEEDAVVEEAQ